MPPEELALVVGPEVGVPGLLEPPRPRPGQGVAGVECQQLRAGGLCSGRLCALPQVIQQPPKPGALIRPPQVALTQTPMVALRQPHSRIVLTAPQQVQLSQLQPGEGLWPPQGHAVGSPVLLPFYCAGHVTTEAPEPFEVYSSASPASPVSVVFTLTPLHAHLPQLSGVVPTLSLTRGALTLLAALSS